MKSSMIALSIAAMLAFNTANAAARIKSHSNVNNNRVAAPDASVKTPVDVLPTPTPSVGDARKAVTIHMYSDRVKSGMNPVDVLPAPPRHNGDPIPLPERVKAPDASVKTPVDGLPTPPRHNGDPIPPPERVKKKK